MSTPRTYIDGDWHATCDSCGFVFLASKLKLRWDGLRVCEKDFEERHPQDFVKAKADKQTVPWSRPEGPDVFVADALCGILESSSIADLASADCSIADNIVPIWYSPVPTSTFTV